MSVRSKQYGRLAHAIRPVMEQLEVRQLMSADPLANVDLVQTLPFALDFNAPVDGLHDKDGEDIGFTRVQVNKNGLAGSYLPANLDLRTDLGVLQVTSTGTSVAGSNFNSDNTLTNAVETQFDATTSGWQVTTRLTGPLGFLDAPSEQGGLMFGPDQDNYVKLVAVAVPAGQQIQFIDEQTTNGVTTHALGASGSNVGVGSFDAINSLDLRLVGDAVTGKVQAFYAVNGGAFQKMPQDLTIGGAKKLEFFNPAGRAGLIVAHKNNIGPVTVSFDRFEILGGTSAIVRPSVTGTNVAAGDTNVSRDAFIAATLLLPRGGVDNATLTADTVRLFKVVGSDRQQIAANIGTSGGGDSIVLTPVSLLDPNATYTFEVTQGVQDITGSPFQPFTLTFRTGASGGEVDPSLAFEKVTLTNAQGENFTSLKIGPDGLLYAGTIDGRILRFPIRPDGTLGTPQVITTLQTINGGGPQELTGLTFDPASTADNLILWASNSQYRFGFDPNSPDAAQHYGDDWTGKITRLSGPNLEQAWDAIVGLPRSVRDHLTNQPSFGPDGALYFSQAASSSMGSPDPIWGNRPEHLLTAAILRLDTTKLTPGASLNVKTEDGGTYNPFAAGAPLTIYASGVRNAFDLVWTHDGVLYAPANGSAAGGIAPATPVLPIPGSVRIDGDNDNDPTNGQYSNPAVPGIARTSANQHDFLFKIDKGGYYGHPNPTRYEFVAGDGYNPADGVLPSEVPDYGSLVAPDRNYRGYAFDFGTSISPDGVIEYQNGDVFNGALKGKLLITRYAGPNDVTVLTRGADGSIVAENHGIAGLRGFADPLDIIENPTNGYLYITEYSERDPAQRRITLLRPIVAGGNISIAKPRMVFNDIITGNVGGSGGSPIQNLRITNTGTAPLSFPAGAFSILDDSSVAGDDSGRFKVVNLANLPDSLAVGESVDVQVQYTATAVGLNSAILRIRSNDPDQGTINIPLRGIGTTSDANGVVSGDNEPSLQRILNAWQISVNVGDSDGEATTSYTPNASSEEVTMQRLTKAGSGPVTIEPLAVFGFTSDPVLRIGYYSPGTKDTKNELFYVSATDRSSVNPTLNGLTSFDPGADFSLYGIFPGKLFEINGLPREVYQEDGFNTWEPDASLRRKVRFFPLKNADGSVVPNAYIFAFEEFNGSYDSNDIVGIIRNVKAAAAGPEIGIENLDGIPGSSRLVFSRIQNQPPAPRKNADGTTYQPPNNRVHDVAKLRVRNTGISPLSLNSLTITGPFELVSPPAAGSTIAPGSSIDLTVKFNANTGGLRTGTLVIASNDADEPSVTIQLAGFWQSDSESAGPVVTEPSLQQTVDTFGYKTQIIKPGEVLNQRGIINRVGDEVLSPYWLVADASSAVSVRQLSSYHTQGNPALTYWFAKGATTSNLLFTSEGVEAQTLLPHLETSTNDSNSPAFAVFKPGTTQFGFRVDGEWSDPAKNKKPNATDQGHHVRFWVARDASGKIVPNTYIMAMDYAGINYDYNDNVYLVSNVKPVNAPAAPAGLTAAASGGGIFLNWNDSPEANVAGYEVLRGTSAGGPFTKITTSLLTQSEFNDLFAPSGVTSYYQVVAVDNAGNRSAAATTNAVRGTDNTPPAAPANLTAMPSTSGITLDWADNTEGDLLGYNVFRGSAPGGPFTKLNGTALTTSSFVDTTAPAGVASYYQVVAVDKTGNVSAVSSANATRPTSQQPPAAPTNLAAQAASATQVNLTWTASSGATTYRIERRVAGGTFAEIASNVTTASYQDSTAAPATSYEYRIVAQNAGGVSGYSNVATASTSALPPPAAPTNLAAVGVSSSQINLTWTASAGAASYRVQRRTAGGTFADVATGATATSYQDTNLPASTTFEYQVLAQGAGGVSSPSNVASAATQAQPTTGFTAVNINNLPGGSSTVPTGFPTDSAFDVVTGGVNIYGNADGFHFIERQVTGDFDVRVRVQSLSATAAVAKAGLMARESLDAGSVNVFAYATPANGYRMSQRAATGGTTDFQQSGSLSYPNVWVRLKRAGNVFTGYWSTDGATWNTLRTITRAMPSSVFLGLAATANTTTQTTTAQFRDFGNVGRPALPAAPSGLTATAATSTQVNLNWTAGAGATSYRVERRVAGGAFAEIASNVATTTYQDATAVAGTSYEYQVRAENAAGLSGYSNIASAATPQALPAAPTNLTATAASSTQVNLSWTASAGATNYRIQRRTPSGLFADITTNVVGTTYVDSTAVASTNYDYIVFAVNSAGSSSASNVASVTTPTGPAVPAAPTGLTATAASSSRINLSWNASNGATSYTLRRRKSGGAFADVAAGLTTTSYQDAGLDAATLYEYQVIAVNGVGPSAPSNLASATTQTNPTPTGYVGLDVGDPPRTGSTVKIGDSAYDVTGNGYDIMGTFDQFHYAYRQISGDFDVKVRLESLDAANAFTKAGLMARQALTKDSPNAFILATPGANGHRFSYRKTTAGSTSPDGNGPVNYPNNWVRLKRAGNVFTGYRSTDGVTWTQVGTVTIAMGQTVYFGMAVTSHTSAATATAKFRDLGDTFPPTAAPSSPAGLTATAALSTQVNLSWSAATGASSYRIERRLSGQGDFAEIASGVGVASYVDASVSAGTSYEYRVRAENSVGLSAPSAAVGVSMPAATPAVAKVLASSTQWSETLLASLRAADLGDGGYAVQSSADVLPWNNIDEFKIRFDGDVAVSKDDLRVTGRDGADYPVDAFTYDAATHTAVWTLRQTVQVDRLTLRFGERSWQVNVLPGDADREGRVSVADLANVRSRLFATAADAGYQAFVDFNGDGRIDALDMGCSFATLSQALPLRASLFGEREISGETLPQ